MRRFEEKKMWVRIMYFVYYFCHTHSYFCKKDTERLYLGTKSEARNFSEIQSLYGESSESFQVPKPLYREKGIYGDSHLAFLYFFNTFLHIFSYFLHISSLQVSSRQGREGMYSQNPESPPGSRAKKGREEGGRKDGKPIIHEFP